MCAGYKGCLDLAVKRKWPGFTCRKCHAFEPLVFDPTEWSADTLACIALIYVTEHPETLKQKSRGNIVLRLHCLSPE